MSPTASTAPRRATGDAGASLITLAPALLVFVTFLLFAVQLLVHLYARSVVVSAAEDGARIAATGRRGTGPDTPSARAAGERQIRQLLGSAGASATIDWSASTDEEAVVRVHADTPHLVSTGFLGPASLDHVDRTARARVERVT